jgi:magnesium transporter
VINAFELAHGRLQQVAIEHADDLSGHRPIWIDLVDPTEAELALVSDAFGVSLPAPQELGDIEASARFFESEDGTVHLRSDFLLDTEESASSEAVAFILFDGILVSVHAQDLPVFRLLRRRARSQRGYVEDSKDALLDLYATDAEYSADALEGVYAGLDAVGRRVLDGTLSDAEMATVLADIARAEDLNGRIRRNVLDTRRAVSFLMRGRLLSPPQFDEARQILRDIDSLDGHTAFLFDKINFLMDASVGFININQNKIIRLFSVAAVALLPPTLIASIYGMNFAQIPELQWSFGYPFALGLMLVSVVLPFWYFHRKGWLR